MPRRVLSDPDHIMRYAFEDGWVYFISTTNFQAYLDAVVANGSASLHDYGKAMYCVDVTHLTKKGAKEMLKHEVRHAK